MRTIIMLAFGLVWAVSASAQVGSSISADGSAPNDNAMLDVKSPSTGAGKGILIPRISENQRTNASLSVPGGLLDDSGNLRGGAAQGLMVYQTDLAEGLYFNASQTATPAWVYLGISTTNYLPLTGGTMSGTLNMGGQVISNTASIDFSGNDVAVGRGANGANNGAAVGVLTVGSNYGAAMGRLADGVNFGAAVGYSANGSYDGAAVGQQANAYYYGAAVGPSANGSTYGAALGWSANGAVTGAAVGASANGFNNGAAVGVLARGTNYGAAVGRLANGSDSGAAVGRGANGSDYGAAMGYYANGNNYGVAVGISANGFVSGAAVGRSANGSANGAALGYGAIGTNFGAAVGEYAYGHNYGAGLGYYADGYNSGAVVGASANGINYGVAVGTLANGRQFNVAIGARANAMGGTNHIAIGYNVTNNFGNDTAVIRGTLYLDGGSSNIYCRYPAGSGSWSNKAFEIDHPLDPENKILRHFCLEGPQVWNVYAGNAQLVNGRAVIELPDYYSALNLVGSEIYSLTPLGGWAPIWVQSKVSENAFVIAGQADLEVSWTIKVLRNDPGCLEDLKRRSVEEWKTK